MNSQRAALASVVQLVALASLPACRDRHHDVKAVPDRVEKVSDAIAEASTPDAPEHDADARDAYELEKDPEFLCRPTCVAACRAGAIASVTVSYATRHSDETIRYPRFTLGDPTIPPAIERQILTTLESERTRFERLPENVSGHSGDRFLNINCAPVFATRDLVSIGCFEETMNGGAHPTKDVIAINLALDAGKVSPVRLDDLFDRSSHWRPEVLRLFRRHLRDRSDRFGLDLDPTDVKDIGPFMVSCHGLHIVDVDLPFAIGPLDATIPWSELTPRLAHAGPAAKLSAARD